MRSRQQRGLEVSRQRDRGKEVAPSASAHVLADENMEVRGVAFTRELEDPDSAACHLAVKPDYSSSSSPLWS
jgi:hypothetical protein